MAGARGQEGRVCWDVNISDGYTFHSELCGYSLYIYWSIRAVRLAWRMRIPLTLAERCTVNEEISSADHLKICK